MDIRSVGRIFATLLLAMLALPFRAQTISDEEDATVKALRPIVGKYSPTYVEAFFETDIVPKFKKSPNLFVRMAKNFEDASDSTRAFKYVRRALALDAKYVPAHVMMGTIYKEWAKYPEDTLMAYQCFDKAIAADPRNPEGYQAYAALLAKTNPDAAVEKLKEILKVVPDYNVYSEVAHIYWDEVQHGSDEATAEMTKKTFESFLKADLEQMPASDIQIYVGLMRANAAMLKSTGWYLKADSVLQYATNKYPRNAAITRLLLSNDISLKKYDEALIAANALFNKSDSLEFAFDDYFNLGAAYMGKKMYDEAIDTYRKCVYYEIKRENYLSDETYSHAKRTESKDKEKAIKQLLTAYDLSGNTDGAIDEYTKYIDYTKETGKFDPYEYHELAQLYLGKYELSMGDEKTAALRNAYDAYGHMVEYSLSDSSMVNNATLALYRRLQYARVLDPDGKEGMGIGDAELMMRLIPSSPKPEGASFARLVDAVRYMANTYMDRKEYRTSGRYFKKLGELDPENPQYKMIMSSKAYRKQFYM